MVIPSTVNVPLSALSSCVMILSMVDFPEPDGPIMERTSPSESVNEMFFITSSPENDLERFSSLIISLIWSPVIAELLLKDGEESGYDIVFMDIVLPDMDGMTAAKKLRESDKSVVLIFVTNMSQYAINGYEVGAADFIVKPFEYEHFAIKMQRIIGRLNIHDVILPVKTADAVISVAASDLKYVEVRGHELIYHTTHGNYSSYGSLSKVEHRLEEMSFVRCNSYYLVNPRYVESINNNAAVVGGDTLNISYAKRKSFRKAVVEYLGGLI